METTANRLNSAKWSRNLSEDTQNEANRLRLLERQRQILETKLQRRQQNQSVGGGIVSSRPATSASSMRSRIVRQASSDLFLKSSDVVSTDDESVIELEESSLVNNQTERNSKSRAKTSIPNKRMMSNSLDLEASPVKREPVKKSLNDTLVMNQTTSQFGPKTNNLLFESKLKSRSQINLKATGGGTINNDGWEETRLGLDSMALLNPLTNVLSDEELLKFVSKPVSPDVTLQCTIIRDKKGLDRSFYPTYYMHLQDIVSNKSEESTIVGVSETAISGSNPNNKPTTNSSGSPEGTATVWMSDSLESINSNDENSDEQNRVVNRQETASTSPVDQTKTGFTNNVGKSSGNSGRKVFVLSGRRRKKSKTYIIGNNAFDISRDRCLAKLKSNVLGTQFTAVRLHQNGVRYEIASISYETNVLGFKGPRKMAIIIPKPDEKTNALCNLSLQEELKRNSRAIMQLKNKTPLWNEETQSYVLNFHGRVTQASVKNFQLVTSLNNSFRFKQLQTNESGDSRNSRDDVVRRSASSHQLNRKFPSNNSNLNRRDDNDDNNDDEDNDDDSDSDANQNNNNNMRIPKSLSKADNLFNVSDEIKQQSPEMANEMVSLQFGRVSNTNFSCDVSYPLSLLQAFAIALSSFDSKLACE